MKTWETIVLLVKNTAKNTTKKEKKKGWASGSRLASELIDVAKVTITNADERASFYEKMIYVFEDADCDTLDECLGVDDVFDEV